ncbi:MAG: hypothetical protein AB7O28_07535 [Vicinamibacterales bacterium]
MADELTTLRALLDDIARRRASLAWRRGWAAGAVAAAVALAGARVAVALAAPDGLALLAVVGIGVVVAGLALAVALAGARAASTPLQVARLVEERLGGLDDVVATAVDYAARPDHRPAIADQLAASALRSAGPGAADAVVDPDAFRQATRRAWAAAAALAAAVALLAGPLGRAGEVAAAYLLPSSLALTVEPGNVRVRAGRPVTITARIDGTTAVTPLLVAGEGAEPAPMRLEPGGAFVATVPDVTASFEYRVVAGGRESPAYTVTVVHPARVERIDLDFTFPTALGLEPRHEDDGGDIYAPEGTTVRLTVTADRAVESGALLMGDGTRVALDGGGRVAAADLTVSADGSYRVAFVDEDGVEMPDDTEYFIRTLFDRPPDVRILRPAGDRQVTPLEEVLIEARADDDFGVRSFDLVLQKPGDAEVVVPLRGPSSALTVNGAHTLYLEDLEVAPGDVVSYYVRARDIGRGKPSSETRSDMFFLEVKAFDDEFVAAQSQAMAASGQAQGVLDLAAAQKEIVVATWKLDSRGRRANRDASAADVRALAAAQRALEQRAAKEAGSQLQPASPGGPRRRGGQATLSTVGDDPIGLAIEAMRRAATELDRARTGAALPHEMEALNQLLKAEADVKRRQVARQQSGGGGGGSRQSPDLSALFDQELRKQQETTYETPDSAETRQDETRQDDPLAALRELARRQEALSREQRDLAHQQDGLDAETVKRRLERLTRDQEQLRRELERLAQQLPQPSAQRESDSQGARRDDAAQAGQKQGTGGQPQTAGAQGASPESGQSAGRDAAGQASEGDRQALRDAVSEMRQASSGLREEDAARASQSAARALEQMRRAEDALRGSTAEDLQRRLGDVQLEARQIAEAQRRLTDRVARGATAEARADARQAAGEQARLAARAERLKERMRALARQAPEGDGRRALDQAGRELEAGRATDLMREASRALAGPDRTEAASGATGASPPTSQPSSPSARTGTSADDAARLGAEAAQALDRVADRLDARRDADGPAAARLSDDLTRTRDLREQLARIDRALADLKATEGRPPAAGASEGRGQEAGASGARADGEVERLRRQLTEELRQAREQVDALGRASAEMRGGSTPEQWQPSTSAPGTEAFKQDFARWDTLKQNLLLALEKVERGLSDALRQQETRDRLSAGRSEAVPDDYRKLVDKYYRSLAAPRRPER